MVSRDAQKIIEQLRELGDSCDRLIKDVQKINENLDIYNETSLPAFKEFLTFLHLQFLLDKDVGEHYKIFEKMVACVYDAKHVGGTNDGGVDARVQESRKTTLIIQCKAGKSHKKFSSIIRELVGTCVINRCSHAVLAVTWIVDDKRKQKVSGISKEVNKSLVGVDWLVEPFNIDLIGFEELKERILQDGLARLNGDENIKEHVKVWWEAEIKKNRAEKDEDDE